jgi:hypothetical protein
MADVLTLDMASSNAFKSNSCFTLLTKLITDFMFSWTWISILTPSKEGKGK